MPPDKTKFAAMAKHFATDTGSSVVDRALQLHGGYGYLMDYPVDRFWRDLRVHSILEGTKSSDAKIIHRTGANAAMTTHGLLLSRWGRNWV